MILEIFSTGPIETNAILVGCEKTKKAIVIDPGYKSKNKLLKKAEKFGLTIEKIYLTHSHWDHFADLVPLKKELDCPVLVHKDDSGNIQNPGSDGLPLIFEIEGVLPDEFLEEGQIHQVGNLSFKVIHTPGHSPGGVGFYFEKEKILIIGDTLFKGTCGRVDLPGANPEKMIASLKKLATLPNDTIVVPGHGPNTTIGQESWINNAQEYF